MGVRTYNWIHTLHDRSDSDIWEHEVMLAQVKEERDCPHPAEGKPRETCMGLLTSSFWQWLDVTSWCLGFWCHLAIRQCSTSSGCRQEATLWALGQELSFLLLHSWAIFPASVLWVLWPHRDCSPNLCMQGPPPLTPALGLEAFLGAHDGDIPLR